VFIVMVSAKGVRSVIEVPEPGWVIEVQTGPRRTYYDFWTVDSAERIVYHERQSGTWSAAPVPPPSVRA